LDKLSRLLRCESSLSAIDFNEIIAAGGGLGRVNNIQNHQANGNECKINFLQFRNGSDLITLFSKAGFMKGTYHLASHFGLGHSATTTSKSFVIVVDHNCHKPLIKYELNN
jgi:hypothetical protein